MQGLNNIDARCARRQRDRTQRAAAIDRQAARLGIAPGVIRNSPDAEEGIEQMTKAMRNLGILGKKIEGAE